MIRRWGVIATAAFVVAACGSGGAAPVTTPGPLEAGADVTRSPVEPSALMDELAAGINGAGFDLWQTQPVDENVVFSPSSIGHALLMARAAADEATGAAIDEAFGLPEGLSAHQAWNAIAQAIESSQSTEVTVTLADRIWPDVSAAPAQAWVDLLAAEHGADSEVLDLKGDPEGSREVINSWVSEQTEGLIPDLLKPGFIHPETALVLTDAIYFEAKWELPFQKYEPVDGNFTKLDGSTTPRQFLHEMELDSPRGAGDGFVAAEIPYSGGDYSMLVVVPDEGRFEEFRDGIDTDLLDEIDASLTTGPFELLLPEWKSHTDIDLSSWLGEFGVAPGSYPKVSPGAVLDAAVHAADIEVDEHGTVAAAATALGFAVSGPPTPELTVAADQPFLYLIRHVESGLALFAGQVVDPTA